LGEIELGLQWEIESGLLLGFQWDWLLWEIESGLLLGFQWDFQWDFQWEIESGLLLA